MKGAKELENYGNIQDLLQIEEADTEDAAPEQEAELIEDQLAEAQIDTPIRLDYKLKTCEERADLVSRILEQTPAHSLTQRYLEILGNYIMGGITKEEKKSRQYLTDNRLVTINKRETSYESLAEKFENGEDGIYNLITNDKNILLTPKVSITQEDIETVPGLKELRAEMENIERASKEAHGRKKYLLKKQLIEMRKDQYILKSAERPSMQLSIGPRGINKVDLSANYYLDARGIPQCDGLISLFNPKHVCALLCHYSALKIETDAKYFNDFYYLIQDFDKLLEKSLREEPIYKDIVNYKIANKTNAEIQQLLQEKHNKSYTVEYISNLWRNKIPKLIAQQAQIDYVIQHFTVTPGAYWKECSRCGELKPAHTFFYSKNNTAKDGWYACCKKCRNAKK